MIALSDLIVDPPDGTDVQDATTRLSAMQRTYTRQIEAAFRANPPPGRRRAPRSEAQTAELALAQSTRIADALEGILDVLRYSVSLSPFVAVSVSDQGRIVYLPLWPTLLKTMMMGMVVMEMPVVVRGLAEGEDGKVFGVAKVF